MDEPEVIQGNMEHTRQALADKLDTLEKKVTGTVETVADTVQQTTDAISGTVETVTDTVQEAVGSAVEGVKSAFDITGHVERHPWLMVGGSVLVGFLAARLFGRRRRHEHHPAESFPASYASHGAADFVGHNGAHERPRYDPAAARGDGAEREQSDEGPSWLSRLGEQLSPLKAMAVGTTLGVFREMIAKGLPDQLRQGFTEVVDNVTTGLGGKPIRSAREETAGEQPSHPVGV